MDALVEKLDARLRAWRPETAVEARERIAELIDLADRDVLDLARSRGAEQQVLVQVELVERRDELPEVVADIGDRERHSQAAHPSQAVRGEPTEICLDVAGVQGGDCASNQTGFRAAAHANFLTAHRTVDMRPLWWSGGHKSRPLSVRLRS